LAKKQILVILVAFTIFYDFGLAPNQVLVVERLLGKGHPPKTVKKS
jgi:hypothetical protein